MQNNDNENNNNDDNNNNNNWLSFTLLVHDVASIKALIGHDAFQLLLH